VAFLFWDASALVKRYFVEMGSETVDAIFTEATRHNVSTTPWGYAETYSILLRRLNGGVLDAPSFAAAVTALQGEVVDSPDFGLLSISDTDVFASILWMRRHNLNATDAAILTMLLEQVPLLPTDELPCVLVAADHRLIRAAAAEGLTTINPEVIAAFDVPGLLAGL
jgi:predicted nucleic acid-binding protein